MRKIKIGICGYGNLGKAVERNILKFPDMEAAAVFTRRDPEKIKSSLPCYDISRINNFKDEIDVLIISMGSAYDLPFYAPLLAENFNIVESYDDHLKIPDHLLKVDSIARKNNKTALISMGWDPGLFSLVRFLEGEIIPEAKVYTFWGKGVSAGHSNALKKIEGIEDAIEYTIPDKRLMKRIKSGKDLLESKESLHKRECFAVLKKGACGKKIKSEIINMPDYFKGCRTKVRFLNKKEIEKKKKDFSHRGSVFSVYKGKDFENCMDFRMSTSSNPDFTSCILLLFARAVGKMQKINEFGAKTIYDIKPKWLIMEEERLLKYL